MATTKRKAAAQEGATRDLTARFVELRTRELLSRGRQPKANPCIAKCEQIYMQFNPSKLVDLPKLLQQYEGREHVLLAKLEDKYGRAKSVPSSSSSSSAAAAAAGAGAGGEEGDEEEGSELLQARNSLPPAWVTLVEEVEDDVRQIKIKMKELTELHGKRLEVTSFDEHDEQVQEREINKRTNDITNLFRHAEKGLKKFGTQGDEAKISDGEIKVRQNVTRSLAKRMQSLNTTFRNTQKTYMNRVSAQKNGSTGEFAFLQEEEERRARGGGGGGDYDAAAGDTGFTNDQMHEVEDINLLVDQRDVEITRIAKSITELAEIFKELAVLVIDQGTILDRIDFNMEQAVEHVKEGNKSLVCWGRCFLSLFVTHTHTRTLKHTLTHTLTLTLTHARATQIKTKPHIGKGGYSGQEVKCYEVRLRAARAHIGHDGRLNMEKESKQQQQSAKVANCVDRYV